MPSDANAPDELATENLYGAHARSACSPAVLRRVRRAASIGQAVAPADELGNSEVEAELDEAEELARPLAGAFSCMLPQWRRTDQKEGSSSVLGSGLSLSRSSSHSRLQSEWQVEILCLTTFAIFSHHW